MAQTLPTYRRQVIATGLQQGGGARSAVSPTSPIGQALGNVAQAGQQVAGALRAEDEAIQQRAYNQDATQSVNMLSEGQVYWQQNFDERTKAWTPGQPDLREGINKDFDKWVTDTEQKLQTEQGKRYFREHAIGMKTKMLTGAYSYQDKATTDAINAQTDAGVQADENLIYRDPSQFQAVRDRRVEAFRARTDRSDADKIKFVDAVDRKYALSAERGEVDRDPAGWLERRFGPMGGATAAAGGTTSIKAAIFGQESGSGTADTSKFNSQGVIGPMQVQKATFEGLQRNGDIPKDWDITNPVHNKAAGDKLIDILSAKYNGDPAKVAAAYYGGEKAVAADGTIKRDMRNLSRPGDPTVGEYVDQVLGRMKKGGPLLASTDGTDVGPLTMGERGTAGNPLPGAPKTYSALDWEQQASLRQMAETKIRQGDARYKAAVTTQMRDAQAMHKDGVVDPVPLTEAQLTRAYGEEGPRLYAEYQNSRLMAADIGSFKSMPAADIAGVIERSKAQPGAGYAAADERERLRMQAAHQVVQQRNADPMGYVVKNTPELAGLRARIDDPATPASERPALTQRFVTDSLAEQQRLGIAQPKILTPAQADSIGQQAMSATRPEDSANLIGSLEAQYGQHFPRVFNELVKGEKISNELLIIPNLPTPAARELVSSMARVKESDLLQGIDAKEQKAAKDAIVVNLEAMNRTIPMPTRQSSDVMNAYESTMRKMAYQFMARGMGSGDAVKKAQSLLLGQYQFEETMRIPQGIDPSAAKLGAQNRMYDSIDGVDVPRDLITGARNPEEVATAWKNTVKANGRWYTNDDDSGVSLWAQGVNGVPYKVTKGGAPVSFTWAQLQMPIRTPDAVPQDMGRAAFVTGPGMRRNR